MPLLNSLENKLLACKYEDISYDEIEIALRLTDTNLVISELANILSISAEDLSEKFDSLSVNEDLTYGITVKYLKILENYSLIEYLKSQMEINDV